MKSLAYTLVCFASIASAHNYYDADVVRPLSHGKSVSYATDGNTVSATDTHSTRTDTASSSGLTPNTTAGVKTAVRELEAGMEELKGYSVDMAGQLQQNGLRVSSRCPSRSPIGEQRSGAVLAISIQAMGDGVRQDMVPAK